MVAVFPDTLIFREKFQLQGIRKFLLAGYGLLASNV